MSDLDMDDSGLSSVAIIGMCGRFPGAPDLDAYWSLLEQGKEGISFFEPNELEIMPDSIDKEDPRHVRAQGILRDIEWFDASFFNIPGREACWLDPQHRVFLESCWWALEDAGYDSERYPDAISVYAGVNLNTYLLSRLDQVGASGATDRFQLLLTSDKDFLATRVGYKLNLRGECIGVQTSCSTSLVAIHMACQSVLSGQSAIALAGGVSIRVPQKAGYVYQDGMISSPDGHCRPFDMHARGTVPGSGVGVIALKPLNDALRDRDHIYAVIRGSAINNDGRTKAGFTAPSVTGQADVITRALAMADCSADTITFVEAHGTGTPVGDPIEVAALTRAFRRQTDRRGYCALGSVKSNIGHLDAAAGIAGLIKAVLALKHHRIPPTVHFKQPNPELRLDESPFYVTQVSQDWATENDVPRRCGISSFGVGGTNAHVVLEEAPHRASSADASRPRLVPISARTPAALNSAIGRLREHLLAHPELELADIAYTLSLGRKEFASRISFTANDRASLLARLTAPHAGSTERPSEAGKLAFLFAGQGSHHLNDITDLCAGHPFIRAHLDRCSEILADVHGFDLRAAFNASSAIRQPIQLLPALFSLEYALAHGWRDCGVVPAALIGHSFGECAAACFAGIFSLEDGLRLSVERGRLMQRLPPGAMLSVHASETQLQPYLSSPLALATVNAETTCVVSGPVERIERLRAELRAARIATQRLPVPFAYHSADIDSIASEYRELMSSVRLHAPAIPLVSNLTGTWMTPAEATSCDYWVMQMRHTVHFSQGLQALQSSGVGTFLEIGPAESLASLARRVCRHDEHAVLSTLAHPGSGVTDGEALLNAIGRLWARGQAVKWETLFFGEQRSRVPLPGYPFERQRYWIEMGRPTAARPVVVELAEDPAQSPVEADAPHPPGVVPRASMSTPFVAPRDDSEAMLISVWEQVLGVRGIGRDDNFLELGGDSLLATQVYARVSEAFPALELEDVLMEQNLAALASRIRNKEVVSAASRETLQEDALIEESPRDNGALPLSFAQEWLWFVNQSSPSSPAYNIPFAARVRGTLSIPALNAALTSIVARHQTLRSCYPDVDGQPTQSIAPSMPIELSPIDLTDAGSESLKLERAWRLLTDEARRPFDMQVGPLFRGQLLRLADDDHIVCITMHHIVCDAWSMGLFARELAAFYPAHRDGRTAALPALSIQYADYAAWQRRRIDKRKMAELIDYWKYQLHGAPQILQLPTDQARPDRPSGRGGRVPFSFRQELTGELRSLGRRHDATLFMVLLSAFSTLLYRESSQAQMLIGVPVAGRSHRGTEDLIGCFINTLPVRVDHGSNPRFQTHLEQVRDTTLAAYAHQDVPFEHIVRACRSARATTHSPLVQVLFDFQNIPPRPPLRIDGLELEPLGAELATAKLDLIIDMWERDGALTGSVEFNADLFTASTIASLMKRFEALLTDLVRNPDARLQALETRTEEEKQAHAAARQERMAAQRDRFKHVSVRPVPVSGEQE